MEHSKGHAEEMSLTAWANAAKPKGEVLVALVMNSRFSDKYYKQWVLLHVPFRDLDQDLWKVERHLVPENAPHTMPPPEKFCERLRRTDGLDGWIWWMDGVDGTDGDLEGTDATDGGVDMDGIAGRLDRAVPREGFGRMDWTKGRRG